MGPRLILALLLMSTLLSGCVSKPRETQAPSTPEEGTGDEVVDELPDIGEITEEELTPEPDLDINDTVDFGSLL